MELWPREPQRGFSRTVCIDWALHRHGARGTQVVESVLPYGFRKPTFGTCFACRVLARRAVRHGELRNELCVPSLRGRRRWLHEHHMYGWTWMVVLVQVAADCWFSSCSSRSALWACCGVGAGPRCVHVCGSLTSFSVRCAGLHGPVFVSVL